MGITASIALRYHYTPTITHSVTLCAADTHYFTYTITFPVTNTYDLTRAIAAA